MKGEINPIYAFLYHVHRKYTNIANEISLNGLVIAEMKAKSQYHSYCYGSVKMLPRTFDI